MARIATSRGCPIVSVAGGPYSMRFASSSMTLLPKISVVTPVFNGGTYLAETLESVLRQDYPNLEYIVVDGGSTDGTLDIIARYEAREDFPQRIGRVISEPDQGMYDALAKGFRHASGEIYCYLNADDLFEPHALRSVGEFFLQHREVSVIYHEDIVLVDGWKYPNVRQPANVDTISLLNGHILFQDGVFWRRAAFEAIGGMRRDFRLAGDFDLWLRLSDQFRFVRRPGHVSCFRMRPGQLSNQRELYHAEMRRSIKNFIAAASLTKRLLWGVQKGVRRAARVWFARSNRERLFFPIDFRNFPPPTASVPPGAAEVPCSPIDGKPAERFLFTTPDTRFGEPELSYIYLDARHDVAIVHPRIALKNLDSLYRKHYSSPPTEINWPRTSSPYQKFNRIPVWETLLLSLPVGMLARVTFRASNTNQAWTELALVLKKANVDMRKPLRFLDVGCFDGDLLDQVHANTHWKSFGLEPNPQAVEIANNKGYDVWLGHAENAHVVIPQDRQFDVIYLGQSIEHLADPLNVLSNLRRLLSTEGLLVVSTPNLDSREIDWFGPTWAHWHVPYHRYIFSGKGLHALVRKAGLEPCYFRTFSNPYWTAMSLTQSAIGLSGSVSHAAKFGHATLRKAQRINFWKKIIWNRLGKGDYGVLVMKAAADRLHDYEP